MFTGLHQDLFRLRLHLRQSWQHQVSLALRSLVVVGLILSVVCGSSFVHPKASAWASIQDDRFDGNIFALYAGNGSLVPPKVTLAQSLAGERPTILTFYIDDSQDCKQFSAVISQIQAYYGRVLDFIPINVDSIPVKASYDPTEPGYYYAGKVPQTLVFDLSGKQVLNVVGKGDFEQFDDVLRNVFDLLPRSESTELKRRALNEVNAELVK
jgi:hypothetical protein